MTDLVDSMLKTNEFWSTFYTRKVLKNTPSAFASWILQNYICRKDSVLDLGCGNGKDTFAFLENGHDVIAIDGCSEAIAECKRNTLPTVQRSYEVFHHCNFENLNLIHDILTEAKINCIYARFILHTVSESVEDKILNFAHHMLPEGGKLFLEFRTIDDPLIQKGEILGKYERFTDHYRRFINATHLRNKLLSMHWHEIYFDERSGYAVFHDEDPVIGRIIVQKVSL